MMAILKKVDAVKEALITEVSNDADMSSRRLIEATLQLDGYIFCKRKNIFYKISLSAIVKNLNELFLTRVLFPYLIFVTGATGGARVNFFWPV